MTTPANPDDLITWLRAQLVDDERAAGRISRAPMHGVESPAEKDYLRFADPARALAEVDAKRRIVDRHRPIELFSSMYCTYCGVLGGQRARDVNWPCPEILDAAAPYADRPGYREDWRP